MKSARILLGKISYINASPVYYGLDHGLLPDWLQMVPDVPSALNRKIKAGSIDISPISAAYYAMNHRELLILPDLSISCNGNVLSVICASNYAIGDLTGKSVMFSKESATSVALLKMIFAQQGVFPDFRVGAVGDIDQIPGDVDAVMVIGDSALTQPWGKRFKFCIDLGGVWYRMTKLPFVFAVWVVRRSFAQQNPLIVDRVHKLLLESKKQGYQHMDRVVEAGKNKLNLDQCVIEKYFDLLHCDLDDKKIRSMNLFFDSLYDQKVLNQRAGIDFFRP